MKLMDISDDAETDDSFWRSGLPSSREIKLDKFDGAFGQSSLQNGSPSPAIVGVSFFETPDL